MHPVLARALDEHADVCVETTGASAEILDALRSLRSRSDTIIARLTAGLNLSLQRIYARDQSDQIPLDSVAAV